ncbi:family 1 polysaccharide lyase [Paramyrothecium foliicola]|nr:family 1 polysaccharide lyase [Paramyrothecium foliicola]
MRFFNAILLLVGIACAAPSSGAADIGQSATLEKRASPSDACNIGYATQNGGTTGGRGGQTVTVSTLDAFAQAVGRTEPLIVILTARLSGSRKVAVKSNKTIVGRNGASLDNIGLTIDKAKNVIVRNLKFTKVKSENGDAITITETTNVWVDHCEFSSERNGGGYDGLVDVTRQSDWVTVSHTYFHDHGKVSLCGAGDNETADKGKLHVTYANNRWVNNVSRGPLMRFGTFHIYNSYYDRQANAVNLRLGAQALVQSTVFEGCSASVVSEFEIAGYAVVQDVSMGGGTYSAPKGTLTSVPYQYSLLGSGKVKAAVEKEAGATLSI